MSEEGDIYLKIKKSNKVERSRHQLPFLGNGKFGRRLGDRIAICMLHDFLLDMDPDLGRNLVCGFSNGY